MAGTAAALRVIRVVEQLAENPLEGERATTLARDAGLTQQQAFRALKDLEAAGWAEQLGTGAWRLTPRPTRIAYRFQLALHDAHRRYLEGSASRSRRSGAARRVTG